MINIKNYIKFIVVLNYRLILDDVFKVVVTNANTGKPQYLNDKMFDYHNTQFKATCSLPIIFPPVTIGNNQYFDGGISDSITLAKSIQDRNRKNLVISTHPHGFKWKLDSKTKAVTNINQIKQPEFSKTLYYRHKVYNQQLQECYHEKKLKKAFISPFYPLKSSEKDPKKLKKTYDEGYLQLILHLNEIRVHNLDEI